MSLLEMIKYRIYSYYIEVIYPYVKIFMTVASYNICCRLTVFLFQFIITLVKEFMYLIRIISRVIFDFIIYLSQNKSLHANLYTILIVLLHLLWLDMAIYQVNEFIFNVNYHILGGTDVRSHNDCIINYLIKILVLD